MQIALDVGLDLCEVQQRAPNFPPTVLQRGNLPADDQDVCLTPFAFELLLQPQQERARRRFGGKHPKDDDFVAKSM